MDMVRTNLSGLDMEQSLRAIMDIRAQLAFLSMDRPRITRGLRGLEDGLAMFNRLGVRINLCLTIAVADGHIASLGRQCAPDGFRESLARFRADRPPRQPHVCRANPEPVLGQGGAGEEATSLRAVTST
jgi:hypothetical protein